jgi:hypothetical protein
MAHALAENANEKNFEIPSSEIECYINHVMKELDQVTDPSSRWAKTGELAYIYEEEIMLESLYWLFKRPIPCKLAFDMKFFDAMAKFASAPTTVSADASERITALVSSSLLATLV